MQARKAYLLERGLFIAIVCTVVFAGLCVYIYLVDIYESHWPPPRVLASAWSATSCIYYARRTHIDSQQPVPRQSEAFGSHASFMLPVGAVGDVETSWFLLSLRDRHASGIVYSAQPASASAAAAVIEIKVKAFYKSEEALRAEMRTICVLRRSPSGDRCGIGVFFVPAVQGHQYSARDDITLNVTVWLPGPRVAEAQVPESQRVIGDPLPHPLPSMNLNAPIEADSAQINTPHRYSRGKFNDVSSSIPTYININDLPLSIMLRLAAQVVRGIPSASLYDSDGDEFFRINAHSLNGPLGIRFFGQAPGEAPDLDVSSTCECNVGTSPDGVTVL